MKAVILKFCYVSELPEELILNIDPGTTGSDSGFGVQATARFIQ